MSAAPVLYADAVTLRRDGRALLDGVSLAIPKGAMASIIGPNGAGKSTLMKLLVGQLKADAGEVRLDDKPLSAWTRRALARRISYVPQSPPVNIPFTVEEFVAMARYAHGNLFGGLDQQGREAVREAIATTGCESLRHRMMPTLSGGEARRAHLAAALAQGGDILLLDEPTTHLDYRHQREVARLLRDIHRERGLTVVAVQHDLNQGVAQSDLVLALKQGKSFHLGPPCELLSEEALGELFGTPFHVVEAPGGEPLVVARHD
jgi:iron complex transport system ATP-binding protein